MIEKWTNGLACVKGALWCHSKKHPRTLNAQKCASLHCGWYKINFWGKKKKGQDHFPFENQVFWICRSTAIKVLASIYNCYCNLVGSLHPALLFFIKLNKPLCGVSRWIVSHCSENKHYMQYFFLYTLPMHHLNVVETRNFFHTVGTCLYSAHLVWLSPKCIQWQYIRDKIHIFYLLLIGRHCTLCETSWPRGTKKG